jgi:nucleotide-binding universal stress UspA family protein
VHARPVVTQESAWQEEQIGRDLVEAHRQRASESRVQAEAVLGVGEPAQVLLEQAATAALIVIGAIGQAGTRQLRLGSVADQLIQQANCPIIVAREAQNPVPGNRVVVGVDASGGSSRALTFAFEEASLRGLPLLVVIARPDLDADGAVGSGETLGSDQRVLREAGIDARSEDLAQLQRTHPNVVVSSEVDRTGAVMALIAHSHDAELLVVGARHHDGVLGLTYSSVSHAVVLHASCTVAVAHD